MLCLRYLFAIQPRGYVGFIVPSMVLVLLGSAIGTFCAGAISCVRGGCYWGILVWLGLHLFALAVTWIIALITGAWEVTGQFMGNVRRSWKLPELLKRTSGIDRLGSNVVLFLHSASRDYEVPPIQFYVKQIGRASC